MFDENPSNVDLNKNKYAPHYVIIYLCFKFEYSIRCTVLYFAGLQTVQVLRIKKKKKN